VAVAAGAADGGEASLELAVVDEAVAVLVEPARDPSP
jgi:hypothetical protein